MNTTIYEHTIDSIRAETGADDMTALDAFERVFRDGYSISGITRGGACAMHGPELTALAVAVIGEKEPSLPDGHFALPVAA